MQPAADQGWRAWTPAPEGEVFALCRALPDRPGLWDLEREPEVARHWVALLRDNFAYVLQIIAGEGDAARLRAAERVGAVLAEMFADVVGGAGAPEVRTVHDMTLVRESLLRAHGIPDPYRAVKAAESERCLETARGRIAAAWTAGAAGDDERRDLDTLAGLLADLLAGNLFDLGSRATQEAYRRGELNAVAGERFLGETRRWLAARPAPGRELLLGCARPGEAGAVLIFADNAGPDFLLGVLPAAVFWSCRRAVRIVVNSAPASNDVTWPEAGGLLARLAAEGGAIAAALESGRLGLVPSGTGSPGIDLRRVGPELNEAARSAAWILIDGQGRGVETNWTTRFSCPVLRVAMIKDPLVAAAIGRPAGTALLRWDDPDPR